MLVKHRHPEPPLAIRQISQTFRLFGWLGFWIQLAMAFVSGLALLFANLGADSGYSSGNWYGNLLCNLRSHVIGCRDCL